MAQFSLKTGWKVLCHVNTFIFLLFSTTWKREQIEDNLLTGQHFYCCPYQPMAKTHFFFHCFKTLCCEDEEKMSKARKDTERWWHIQGSKEHSSCVSTGHSPGSERLGRAGHAAAQPWHKASSCSMPVMLTHQVLQKAVFSAGMDGNVLWPGRDVHKSFWRLTDSR